MLLIAVMVALADNQAKHIITLRGKVHTVLMLRQMLQRFTSRL